MTQRSVFKDDAYWRGRVEFLETSIARFTQLAADNPDDRELRTRGLIVVVERRLDLIRALYSAGAPVKQLATAYQALVAALAANQADPDHEAIDLADLDGYVALLSMLSLGLLLGATAAQLQVVLDAAGKPGRDALFDGLARRAVATRKAAARTLHPKPFEPLARALRARDADEAGPLVVRFLEAYYPGLKKTYFHDSHLKDDAGFAGYWSFEAAAVVVARDVDDSGFADNVYYPHALADHARKRRDR